MRTNQYGRTNEHESMKEANMEIITLIKRYDELINIYGQTDEHQRIN
jgi:hypothetical protein